MAQTLAARATSLAASTALLALAAVAVFSLKWAIGGIQQPPDLPPILSMPIQQQPTIPPPTSHPVQHVRPADPTQPAVQTDQPVHETQIADADAGQPTADIGPPTISNPHW